MVPRKDYLQLLRGAAAVVQPSLFEGWSSVVEDARAFGKPIALSDIAVHREQTPPGSQFFAPDDPHELATAVEQALASPSMTEEDAQAAQALRVQAYGVAFASLARDASSR